MLYDLFLKDLVWSLKRYLTFWFDMHNVSNMDRSLPWLIYDLEPINSKKSGFSFILLGFWIIIYSLIKL